MSRELWETVQDMRKERREKLDNGVHLKKGCHPLYGKIFCAHCGMPYCRRITRAHNGSKEVSWECVERFKGNKGNGCMNPIVKERHILKTIGDKIGTEKAIFNIEICHVLIIGLWKNRADDYMLNFNHINKNQLLNK